MTKENNIIIFKGSEIIRLHKEMSMDDIKVLLGNNYTVESCSDKHDQKWVYNFSGTNGIYKLLFRNDKLEWAMKGTYFVKKPASIIISKPKTKEKKLKLSMKN